MLMIAKMPTLVGITYLSAEKILCSAELSTENVFNLGTRFYSYKVLCLLLANQCDFSKLVFLEVVNGEFGGIFRFVYFLHFWP